MNTTEILQELGIDYRESGEHPNVRSGFIGVNCPRCTEGKSGGFKLGIPLGGRGASCWTCGRLRLAEVLHELSGAPWGKIKELLGSLPEGGQPWRRPAGGKLILPPGVGPLQAAHRRYLEGRGFDPDRLARLYGVAGIGLEGGRLAWRLFLPVIWHGETVSWTTRAVADTQGARYHGARPEQEVLPAKTVLYGGDYVRHAAVVCEGPFDAMRIGPGAVATLGVQWTEEQKCWLGRVPVRVICFDGEPAAQRRAEELAGRLAAYPGRTAVVRLESGPDPASAEQGEIDELRRLYLDEK